MRQNKQASKQTNNTTVLFIWLMYKFFVSDFKREMKVGNRSDVEFISCFSQLKKPIVDLSIYFIRMCIVLSIYNYKWGTKFFWLGKRKWKWKFCVLFCSTLCLYLSHLIVFHAFLHKKTLKHTRSAHSHPSKGVIFCFE